MGNKVHWTKGEHPVSIAANTCNLSSPSISMVAVAATLFTGAFSAACGDLLGGSLMLASAWPQYKLWRLNQQHSDHTVSLLQRLNEQHTWIEQDTPREAWQRCRLAATRLLAPAVIFGVMAATAHTMEPPQAPDNTLQATATPALPPVQPS